MHGPEPSTQLLRLRDLQKWISVSRDRLEALEAKKKISPLRKKKGAKALYRKWQFYELISPERMCSVSENRTPSTFFVRRRDVVAWLSVTNAKFEAWADEGLIHPVRFNGKRTKAYFRTDEIEVKILGVRPTKPFTPEQLIYDYEQRESAHPIG